MESKIETTDTIIPLPPTHKPIQKRHDWPILIIGSFVLTIHSGWINSTTVLLLQTPVAHMSGHFTALGLNLEQAKMLEFGYVLGVLVCFCFGCCVSGLILGVNKFSPLQPYSILLLIMCATECLSSLLLMHDHHSKFVVYPLAFSCGVQNALCTTWSGAVIRTTHFTGIITDTGLVIGHWIRFKLGFHEKNEPPVDSWKLVLFIPIMVGFTIGAVLGAYTFYHFEYLSVLFPGVFIGLCGIVYRVFKLKSVYFDFYRRIESSTKTEAEQELKPLVSHV